MSKSRANIKVKHIWTVLCQRSLIDNDSNNISLIDVLEQIAISPSPSIEKRPAKEATVGLVPIRCELISLWARASEDQPALGHARTTLLSPSGRLGKSQQIQVDLRSHIRLRTRQRFEGLPVKEAGQYLFSVEYREDGEADWHEVAAVPLQVIIEPSPRGGPKLGSS